MVYKKKKTKLIIVKLIPQKVLKYLENYNFMCEKFLNKYLVNILSLFMNYRKTTKHFLLFIVSFSQLI